MKADHGLRELVTRRLPAIVDEETLFRLKRRSGRSGANGDLPFVLLGEGIAHPIRVQVRKNLRPTELGALLGDAAKAREAGATLMVVAPTLGAGLRKALRAAGIGHADLGGTLFLQAPGIAVRIEGSVYRAPARAGASEQNPFADRASLVLRAMMREPDREWGVREMAAATCISTGLASQTADAITRRGYAAEKDGRLVLADAASALIDWAALEPWAKNRVKSFVAPFDDADELAGEAWPVVERLSPGHAMLTQLAALDEYAPHVVGHGQVHLYCEPDDFEAAAAGIVASLYAEPVRTGGNLHLVRPSARGSTGFDSRMRGGKRVVSPVQLFLDLAAYPVRGIEGAQMLARAVLGQELGLGAGALTQILDFLEAR
jgi:hypothetical protein